MRILTKEELKNEPNGTVYVSFIPRVFTGEIHIITGKENDKGEWNGELPFLPDMRFEGENNYLTQWCTVDNTWWELDDNTKYAVFSKNEIHKMIDCLQWALTGCKMHFNQDEWWSENRDYPLTDMEAEDYR